jgi:hypothetical protein
MVHEKKWLRQKVGRRSYITFLQALHTSQAEGCQSPDKFLFLKKNKS